MKDFSQSRDHAQTAGFALEWRPINRAPRNGKTIQARIPGHGDDNLIAWIPDALENEHGPCGAWTFTSEQEPPPCWSDGWCWAVNEDGVRSVWPTHWKPAPLSSAEPAEREGSRDTDKPSSPTQKAPDHEQ